MSDAVLGGLADPVLDAQRTFRAVMDALARPGRVVPLPAATQPPAPLTPAAGAVLATLGDETTPVFLGPAGAAAERWLSFHTGAAPVAEPGDARFAVVEGATLDLSRFAPGTAEYPDRSATVVVLLDSLTGGTPLRFAGPGIVGTVSIAPAPLPADFAAQWARNAALFPCGVDLLLLAGDSLAGLPRSARMVA